MAYLGFVNSEAHKQYVEDIMVRKILKEFGCGLSVLHRELFEADLKPLLDANDRTKVENHSHELPSQIIFFVLRLATCLLRPLS
jgi:hypothetical protein